MRTFILLLFTMNIVHANAQLTSGHYSLAKKEYLGTDNFRYSSFDVLCECDSLSKLFGLGRTYYCASLDVFDGTLAYFKTGSLFDTGNTRSTNKGEYLVAPVPVAKNRYLVKSKLIELEIEVVSNDEVEVTVHNCVEHYRSEGIFNRNENRAIQEKVKYYFKKNSSAPQSLAFKKDTKLEALTKRLGVNYGAYKVFDDKVIWEDITRWEYKKEVREIEHVAIKTFEVCKYQGSFYLIMEYSHRSYPPVYTDYAKDSAHVYYQGQVVKGATPADFEVLDPVHAKTSKNAYCRSEIIPTADIATFKSLNGGYAMDKNHYYREGKIVKKNSDVKTLLEKKQAAK